MTHPHQHNYTVTTIAIIMLAVGLLIWHIIGRRRFNRRGIGGTQYFNSYNTSLIIPVIERILNIVGALLILAGIFFYFIS